MEKIKVLLADDHTMFREGLRQILERQADMTVVGEAGDGREAAEKVESLAPNIVLVDISMPVLDGVKATRLITEHHPGVGVIILSMYGDDEYVFEAIKAGARGYLLKGDSSKNLIEAIRVVHRGEVMLGPGIAGRVLAEFRRLARDSSKDRLVDLSKREVRILRLVAEGASNKEIGDRLSLSEQTIKNYLSTIYQKLHVSSRTEAAIKAIREGLI
ncbi:MAG: response regulator transcription factor [Anaerolineales bacterium]|nr:response regulator transcription factor [Anaerolineales bacterium]